jgi:hypothetical protein
MFSNTLKRSVATLSIMAGLLAAAGPAGAQGGGADFPSTNKPLAVTMLDYMGSPLFDNTPLDGVVFSAESRLGRENSIACLLRAEASDEGQTQSHESAPLGITLCHEGFEIQ